MVYDCIVIGGGVVGSSAAYHLAMKGKETLLLEQFSLPHTRGSSHGATRVLRASYEDPIYSKMTVEALQLWKRLERETNTKLFQTTGLMVMSDLPSHEMFEGSFRSVQSTGGSCEELSPDEVYRKYPGLLKFSPNQRVYVEHDGGTLRADKSLACLREQIKKFGGYIQDEEKVTSIMPGRIVTVRTNKGTYRSHHLIITPGAWISQLLQPFGIKIPFRVERINVCYWKENIPGVTKNMMTFIDLSKEVYGLPNSEYEGLMKVCLHKGITTDPDSRDACMDDKSDVEYVCNFIKERFPGLACKPSIVESCMYTLTPDSKFVLDNIPNHSNIVFGAGFSGHGFKMAPVVGRILGEMVMGEKVSYDISSMSVKRFPGATLTSNL